jgi:membrane protein DedA with SNARE-associated domain
MGMTEQTAIVLTALASVLGGVNPWLAALWLMSAIVLACLLVYGWQRLVTPRLRA